MPIPDNVNDRLKGALVAGDPAAADGNPMLVTADPSGFTVGPTESAINTAVTLNQAPETDTRTLITGFEVALRGLGGVNAAITVNLLASGAVIWGTFIASGSTAGLVREFARPLNGGLAASVALYVGPGGASMFSLANLRGYTVGGRG